MEPKLIQSSSGLSPRKLNIVLDYIQHHLSEDLSLDSIAAQIGVSRCYFATQFKQAMGIAPYRYVQQQRIEKSKQLLRSPKRSILDVAMDCGFVSQSHFTKAFKKQTGATPKIYREQ